MTHKTRGKKCLQVPKGLNRSLKIHPNPLLSHTVTSTNTYIHTLLHLYPPAAHFTPKHRTQKVAKESVSRPSISLGFMRARRHWDENKVRSDSLPYWHSRHSGHQSSGKEGKKGSEGGTNGE